MQQVLLGVVLVWVSGFEAGQANRAHQFQIVGSAAAEALAGDRAAPKLEQRFGGVVFDAAAEDRLARVVDRLVANSPELAGTYRFQLLASDDLNAFSLPGGRIYITRGLYDVLGDDRLLAAVCAHEMGHLVAGDSFKPRCSCTAEALDREALADACGVMYLENAGFSSAALEELVLIVKNEQPAGWAESRCRRIAAVSARRQYLRALASIGLQVLLRDCL